MKTLEKVSDFAGKYMAIIALAVAIIALIIPGPVHSVLPTSWVNTLLGIVMFGMGMTLKLSDFKVVFTKPKAVIVGICSQFIVMPLACVFARDHFPASHRARRRRHSRWLLPGRYVL